MKNGIHDKKARTPILITLILVSLAEVIYRAIAVGAAALGTANSGEQVTILAFAAIILFFTAKGNEKISYVSCGALIAYFVMDQLIGLPGMIGKLLANISNPIVAASVAIRILTMIGVVVLAALLAEYVNDGSIYNRTFVATYWITVLLHVVTIIISVAGFVVFSDAAAAPVGMDLALLQKQGALLIFNDLYRIVMVVLFVSFAYESAKLQLKREQTA